MRAGVDQEDDVGFEPLGAVHGHHADLVAERFGVALDLGLGRVEPVRESPPATGRRICSMGERLGEELVEHVLGLGAETHEEAPATLLRAEDAGEEGMRVEIVGRRPPGLELRPCRDEVGVGGLPSASQSEPGRFQARA